MFQVFSETRLGSDLASLYQLPGYNLYTKCRNRNGGFVALYITSAYHLSVSTDLSHLDSLECLGVDTVIMDKIYLVICIYTLPVVI